MDDLKLTGPQYGRLLDLLSTAFTDEKAFRRMVRVHLAMPLSRIPAASSIDNMAMVILDWAEEQSQVTVLVLGALAENPTHEGLRTFAEGAGLLAQPTDPVVKPVENLTALSHIEQARRYRTLKARYTVGDWHGVVADALPLAGYLDVDSLVSKAKGELARLEQMGNALTQAYAHGNCVEMIRLAQQLGPDTPPEMAECVVEAWGQVSIETQVLRRHDGWVQAVAVSADGQHVVSGSINGMVRRWRPADGPLMWCARRDKGPVWAVAVSADDQHILSGSDDGTVRRWRLTSGMSVWSAHRDEGPVRAAAVSGDGQLVVSGSDNMTVQRWQLADGAPLWTARGHEKRVDAVAVSADGQYIISGSSDGTVRRWRPSDGELLWTAPGHTGWVLAVAASADGQHVVSGSWDGTVRRWRSTDGSLIWIANDHEGPVHAVAVSSDGQHVISGSDDGTVRLWRPADGVLLRTLRGHEGTVLTVAVSANGRTLVSGGTDGTVRVWRLPAGMLG